MEVQAVPSEVGCLVSEFRWTLRTPLEDLPPWLEWSGMNWEPKSNAFALTLTGQSDDSGNAFVDLEFEGRIQEYGYI